MGELMHEWCEADAVLFDVTTEEVIAALIEDNRELMAFVRECGLEVAFRKRQAASKE